MNRIILSLILLLSFNLYGQDTSVEVDKKPIERTDEDLRKSLQDRYLTELINIRYEMNKAKSALKKEDMDMVQRLNAETRLSRLQSSHTQKRYQFIESLTEVNISDDTANNIETSFADDIKQILDPVLSTFKKISERPREIQRHSEQLSLLNERLIKAEEALRKLNKLLVDEKFKKFNPRISESRRYTEKLVENLVKEKDQLEFKISNLGKADESIISTFSSVIFEFIKTKGKNLVLAFVVFILVYWGFRVGQRRLLNVVLFKMHQSDSKEVYQWVLRPIKVVYSVFSTMVAFFLSLLTLYVLNDWVLVTLILIVITALIWSSKQYLPLFFEQSKIILNLGMVREGERVMLYGLPWQIKGLGYYCHLHNPALAGGDIKVSTKELLNANSRRVQTNEYWFPSVDGDWVEFDDHFGRVIQQTPSHVVVRLLGGENIHIPSVDFYAKGAKNLSRGFAVEFVFGLDYSHQKDMFDKVIPTFKDNIRKALIVKHPELEDTIHEFNIDFLSAGASSLDLRFFMKCDGKLAHLKRALMRSVQTEFVKVCNEHDYIIPFNQLTVHMQK